MRIHHQHEGGMLRRGDEPVKFPLIIHEVFMNNFLKSVHRGKSPEPRVGLPLAHQRQRSALGFTIS